MATIIDALFIELGFDTTKLTDGQRKAAASLRELERDAEKSAGRIETGAGQSLHKFFSGVSDPVQTGIKNLATLSEQARRSGGAVAAGAGVGAAGLAALAAAGLGAYTALKSVQEITDKITTTTASTAATGRLATMTGVSPQWMSAVQIAANVATHADKAATGESLFTLRQMVERLNSGQGYDPRLQQLATYFGISDLSGPADEVVQRIIAQMAERGQHMTAPEMQSKAGGLFSREFLQWAQQGPDAVNGGIRSALPIAQTQAQTEAAQKLQRALDGLGNSWEALVRRLQSDQPWLTGAVKKFDEILRALQESPEAMNKVEIGIDLLAAAFGVTLVVGIGKAVAALNAFWAVPAIRFLATPWVAGPLAFLWGMQPGTAGVADEKQQLDEHVRRGDLFTPPAQRDTRGWWERNMPTWLGGKDGPQAPKGDAAPGASNYRSPETNTNNEAFLRSVIRQAGGNAMAQAGLLSNFDAESNGLDPTAVNPTSGATGFAQWLGPRLRRLREIGDPKDREAQGKLLHEELTGKYAGALQRMNAATSPKEAAAIGLREFEGVNPSNSELAGAPWDRMLATHTAKADQFYRRTPAAEVDPATTLRLPSGHLVPAPAASDDAALRKQYAAAVEKFNAREGAAGDNYAPNRSGPESFEDWKARSGLGQPAGPAARMSEGLDLIRGNQATVGAGGGASKTVNHGDVDVGGVNVTVPPGSDGLAIGGAVAAAMQREILANQANTGQE
jgi:hypothetical protein